MITTGLFLTVQSRGFQNWLIGRVTSVLSERTGADISIGHVNIALFRKIVLDDVYVGDKQKDTLLFVEQLVANVDSLSIRKKRIHFKEISLVSPKIDIRKIDSLHYNFSFLTQIEPDTTSKNEWIFHCNTFSLKSGDFNYQGLDPNDPFQNWSFSNFNTRIDGVTFPGFENFSFTLSDFNFKDDNGLNLRNMSVSVFANDSLLTVKNLSLKTDVSSITIDSLGVNLKDYKQTKDFRSTRFALNMPKMRLGLSDLDHFYPQFSGSDLYADVSLQLSGKVNALKGKAFSARLSDVTSMSGDFYINGLPDLEQTYVFLNLDESFANLQELRKIDFPKEILDIQKYIPEFLSNIGTFTYTGNFTGFMTDFVTYGTAYSDLGIINGDLSFKPVSEGKVQLNGNVRLNQLNIGSIFGNKMIGKISGKGDVKGTLTKFSTFDLAVKGLFSEFDFNQYRYSNLSVNGNIKNKLFNGKLVVDDPNLKMDYSGRLDLSTKIPIFDFETDVKNANLYNLHFYNDSVAQLSFKMKANFQGRNLDNMIGQIDVDHLDFINVNNSLSMNHLQLRNDTLNSSRLLTLTSDYANLTVSGKYQFSSILKSFENLFYYYVPSSSSEKNVILSQDPNSFEFDIQVIDLNELTQVFYPNFQVETPCSFSGFYKPVEKTMLLDGSIPKVVCQGKEINAIKVRAGANGKEIFCRVKSDLLKVSDSFNIYNLAFETHGKLDLLKANLYWNNYDDVSYSGSIETETTFSPSANGKIPKLDILVLPSKIYFADSLWTMSETKIVVDSSSIFVELFELTGQSQRFMIDGKISKNETDFATLNLDNIDLSLLKPLLKGIDIRGKVNGNIRLADLYKKKMIDLDLVVKSFDYGSGYLGDLFIKSAWDDQTNLMNSHLTLVDQTNILVDGHGWIDPLNSKVDVLFKFDHTPLSVLKTVLPDEFYNEDGKASGEIRVSGHLLHLNLDGSVTPDGLAQFGLTYLKTTYFTKDRVDFSGDKIIFPNMTFIDELGNKGTLNGWIQHQSFFKMVYDLQITANQLHVMNTTIRDNSSFYGTAFASGALTMTGRGENILLAGKVKSEKGTAINIPFESGVEAAKHDFIEFVDHSKYVEEKADYKVVTSGFNMDFDVDVTPDAKVQIIFNSQIGDIIKGEGSGNLQVKVDKNFNIELYGDYNIDKGDYLFTFQNLINKHFTIDKGGSIKWVGDPYNALLDISAVYKVKTSLNDLFAESSINADLTRRMPVDCIIKLDESLLQPRIRFDIQLPTADKWIADQVKQLIVTEEDVNKQMISLLFLGRFYTPEIIAGNNNASTSRDLVGTTASELFSNQLSNWLSKISDSWDFGVRYRPGNELSTEQLEVALSTQIFNNRVTINGNVANNSDRNANTSNSQLVGDFDINVKLVESGKLQFKIYSRANDNLNIVVNAAPYTQGVGITYKEEFNTFEELMKRYKNALFGGSKKKNKIKNEVKTHE